MRQIRRRHDTIELSPTHSGKLKFNERQLQAPRAESSVASYFRRIPAITPTARRS